MRPRQFIQSLEKGLLAIKTFSSSRTSLSVTDIAEALVKDIFDLDRCWMRGDENNRWIFTAMGLTIQMHQLQAFKQGRST